MSLARVETVASSSALSAAICLSRSRSAAISSWLAMTAPHSCARTDKRKVSWSDRSSLPVTIKKTCSRVSGEVIGNAQHGAKAFHVEPGGPGQPGQETADALAGPARNTPLTCLDARLRRYGKRRSTEPPW